MLFGIIIFLVCYLIGSISPAIIVCKKVKNADIRELGSKNAGATNAIRVLGKKLGITVFVLDMIKGIMAYFLTALLLLIFKTPYTETYKTLVVLSVMIGHMYPIYYSFKGGKGVTVFLATCLVIDTKATLVCLAVGLIIIAVTRWVSLGSICGSALVAILSIFMNTNFNPIIIIICSILVIYKHRANIGRLIAGTESKLFAKDDKR